MRKTIEGLWLSKISLQSRVASCHLINLLLLKKLTYPMWCFVVLFTFLRTLSAPKLRVQHHHPAHIPFPSTQSWERSSLQQVLRGSPADLPDSLHVIQQQSGCSVWVSVQPQGHQGKWLVPADVMAVTGLGTESPCPCAGLQSSLWKHFLAPAASVVRNAPCTPLAALQGGIVPFPFPCWHLWSAEVGFSWSSNAEGHQEPFWLKVCWKA